MSDGRLILFKGRHYWLISDDKENGAIAPLEHCDGEGNLLTLHGEDSYAHVTNGIVERYRRKIGTSDDITFVETVDVALARTVRELTDGAVDA